MGFNLLHCQKAAINTSNSGVEAAMDWLLNHMNDPGSFNVCFQAGFTHISRHN